MNAKGKETGDEHQAMTWPEQRPNLGRHKRNCSVCAHAKVAESNPISSRGGVRLPSPRTTAWQTVPVFIAMPMLSDCFSQTPAQCPGSP
jgi:hypothetical protein